ncbi:MAG: hypothetical protein H6581_11745 [Bacteroidia bacterium]|nr:hypothetical protein [Bacteroidia bacterium]
MKDLSENLSISLRPFLGYYVFGGKSRIEPNGYQDIFLFKSVEAGLIPSLEVNQRFRFSFMLKGQYIIETTARYYGTIGQPDSIPRTWASRDFTPIYSRIAMNTGLRFDYKMGHFFMGMESWVGFTNLNALRSEEFRLGVFEKNLRLCVGFEL